MTKTALYTFLAIIVAALYLVTHFTLNESQSEPIGLYRPTHSPFKRGSLVLLKDPLKRVVGMPGDCIRTTREGTYVNTRLVPDSGIPAGSPYRPYPFTILILGPDQYWVLGDHRLSYDSRYYGPVPGSLIASTVEPFYTWK
jgi:type IV secretory pathway protease TraF